MLPTGNTLLPSSWQSSSNERTNGDVEITVYPSNQLGNDAAMINGTRGGTIDIVSSSASNFNGIVANTAALELPFVFRNAQHAYNVLDGAVGTGILEELAPHSLKGLAYWENGWRAFTNNKRPIRTPDDVKGLKIRSTGNPYHIQAFELLGMNPLPCPCAELYTALESGTFDAQEHPINVTWSSKFYEVQKFLTVSNHVYSPLIVAMNKAKFDSLPANHRTVIVDAAREAAKYQRELNAGDASKVVADLKKSGVQVIEVVDVAPFQKLTSDAVRQVLWRGEWDCAARGHRRPASKSPRADHYHPMKNLPRLFFKFARYCWSPCSSSWS
jgi:tripartite ATP-independent transporter DctP family solute receptor